uniref:Uncharacterized protein n=1 Tax=Aegilops tauschii subsp. strangulata TaxID=200361 RepID=A0A453KTT2_AEGTS
MESRYNRTTQPKGQFLMSNVWRYSSLVLIVFLLILVKIVPQEISQTATSDHNMPDKVHYDGEHNRTSSTERRGILNARRRATCKEQKEKESTSLPA